MARRARRAGGQAVKAVIRLIDGLPPLHRQIARFIVTGGVNSVFGYVVYVVIAGGFDLPALRALVLSYMISVPFSYLTFRTFVFTSGDRSFRSFAKFLPTYVVILLVNMAGLHWMVEVLLWNKLIAQAIIVPFCAVLSFVINRIFVFKEGRG